MVSVLGSRCRTKPTLRDWRTASLAAAMEELRPTATGEITPGNRTAFRIGMRIRASSGIGRTASYVPRPRRPGVSLRPPSPLSRASFFLRRNSICRRCGRIPGNQAAAKPADPKGFSVCYLWGMGRLEDSLRALPREQLRGMRRGIEKESLRTRPDGALALTPHSFALGSALAHPHITTDFSESQLELITGVHDSAEACLQELTHIHQAVYRAIGEELMWVGSMPCGLPAERQIPIGRYGSSNIGRAKTVYRNGLSWRYGRRMQTISGIHYNWSMPGLANAEYFSLIRNFRRHGWLLFYLFGASPAVCSSFVAGRSHPLKELRPGTLHLPHATSLRMGRLGYQSDAQSSLVVSCNDLLAYGKTLQQGLTQVYPPYAKIGIREPGALGDGPGDLPPALHDAAADRERVLRQDPAQAPHHARRAPAARAARARRGVRGSAPHGPRSLRAGGDHGAGDAVPRRVPAALPAHRQPARHARRHRLRVAQPGDRGAARARAGPEARLRPRGPGPAGMGREAARGMRADRGRRGCRARGQCLPRGA